MMFEKSFIVVLAVSMLLINVALMVAASGAQGQAIFAVKDFQGVDPLAGAKVVILNAVNPADRREYVADNEGRVAIAGIDPAARYVLEVHWRSPRYAQEDDLVLRREIRGDELLRISEVRTHVFKVTIKPVTVEGEGLSGLPNPAGGRVFERFAGIYLDDVELARGVPPQFEPLMAEASLVPQGKHRLQVYWAGYEVYNEEVYIGLGHLRGYIPGIDDLYEEELKKLSIIIVTRTSSLTVLVTYMGEGHRAIISITDLEWRFEASYRTLPTPLKLVGSFPIIPLELKVEYPYVPEWEVLAEAVCTPDPKKICEIAIPPEKGPFYIIRIKVVTGEGYPVRGARAELSGYSERPTDAEGITTFYLVRPGTHTLKVFIGDRLAAERKIEVRRSEEVVVPVDVELHPVRVDVQLVTFQGRPYEVYWSLEGGGLRFDSGGKPSSRITIERLPPGTYKLWIKLPETGFEYIFDVYYLDLAKDRYTLPVGDVKIRFLKDGVDPIPNAEVILRSGGASFKSRTNAMGEAVFENLPTLRTYEVELWWGDGYSYAGKLDVLWREVAANIPSGEIRRPIIPTITMTVTVTETTWITETVKTTQTNTVTRTVMDEATRTVTVTRTETAVAERTVLPMIPLMIAAAAATILIAGSLIAARRWRMG